MMVLYLIAIGMKNTAPQPESYRKMLNWQQMQLTKKPCTGISGLLLKAVGISAAAGSKETNEFSTIHHRYSSG